MIVIVLCSINIGDERKRTQFKNKKKYTYILLLSGILFLMQLDNNDDEEA